MIDKEKCYKILDKCRNEIEIVFCECNDQDTTAAHLALELIMDIDKLRIILKP